MSKYHELFEKLPDGITLHDARDGSIVDSNQQFCDLLGYSREELLELGFDDIHVDEPPYTSDRAEEPIRKAAENGPQTFEWMDQTKGGETFPVEVHLRQTEIEGEERILAVVRDIRERKRRQRELERRNERLEQFAGIVSHDLRNPLNVAQGRLELAMEECDSDHLEAMSRAHARMEVLIEDLLSVAREGERSLDVEPVGLQSLVEDCWKTVATEDATLQNDTTGTIRADEQRVKQLLENLFRNAVEHGGSNVTVTVGDQSAGFYVEDDGPGVPPDIRNDVRERGYADSAGGAGFGFAIVSQIADSHDWHIDIGDSEDGGARIDITNVEPADM